MEFNSALLTGGLVALEPINTQHLEGLQLAASAPKLWHYIPFALNDPSIMELYVGHVSSSPEKGEGQAYAIRHNETGRVIGGSGYWHIDHQNNKLEIGGSWLMEDFQRSGVNTEVKYLLLKNAFEVLGCNRVGFSIDARNEKSLRAIERIGATKEGVLRCDMVMHDGSLRDSAIYSVVKREWPAVQEKLKALQAAYA